MPTENSQSPKNATDDRLTRQLRLLEELDAGQLDELECPQCLRLAVSVWFSHPAKDEYRTWFICGDCDFHTRVQNSEKPRFFSENRVSTDLQERDVLILKQAIFKKPPSRIM
jgi:hypothetical protein